MKIYLIEEDKRKYLPLLLLADEQESMITDNYDNPIYEDGKLLADLAKKYTAPEGELLAALDEDTVVGMVAYHRHSDDRCEMKRLYVKPDCRGSHLGRTLIGEILEHASRAGYKEMVLDTIEPLQAAIHLYREAGFQECEPYYDNPMEDVIYFKKELG